MASRAKLAVSDRDQKTLSIRLYLILLAFVTVVAADLAKAGSLAPAPRVTTTYEHDFLHRTGAQTFEELLNTGIIRYFFTGGQSIAVLVNGRPYASSSSNLDSLPISFIERIEVIRGDSLGTLGGLSIRGAINIVLRNNLDDFEARTVFRQPSRDGGGGRQGSLFWGSAAGEGRITMGVDILSRERIAARSREFSRSVWQKGGSFSNTKNVSRGGNTVYIFDLSERELRSISLGDCDPDKNYTGPLSDPPGIDKDDDKDNKGCGFAYGNVMWNTSDYDQRSILLNFDHPIGESANFHFDANVTESEGAFRYAPPVGTFGPFQLQVESAAAATLLPEIQKKFPQAEGDDFYYASHRFVGHGNRDWTWDADEYEIAARIDGKITDTLGYDVLLNAYDLDGYWRSGYVMVSEEKIIEEVLAGNYNLANPFSSDPAHQQAIRNSSTKEQEHYGESYEGIRMALEGVGFAIGERNSAWTAGIDVEQSKAYQKLSFTGRDGTDYKVTDILGSGGTSYSGERESVGAFAEISMPLSDQLDFRVAGRADDYDTVGNMEAWRVGADYQATDKVTLSGSWSTGETSPSFYALYTDESQGFPYINCTYDLTEPPPRTCLRRSSHQVARYTTGNPELEPVKNEKTSFGIKYERRRLLAGLTLHRTSRTGVPGRNTADWSVRNLPECEDDNLMNCIDIDNGYLDAIRDSFANVVDDEVQGVDTRFRWGTLTDWGIFGMDAQWRHISSAERRLRDEKISYPIPKDVIRLGFLAKRGDWSLTWSINHRSEFENASSSGVFDSWTGHDLVLDWTKPFGYSDSRLTAGIFNVTDTELSIDSANQNSVDGPAVAGWGRTFFLTLNIAF